MRKKEGFFLTVFLDHADDQEPIYVWLWSGEKEAAIVEARGIIESLIGWNDSFLGFYVGGILDHTVEV
jgi:hypothetical protein